MSRSRSQARHTDIDGRIAENLSHEDICVFFEQVNSILEYSREISNSIPDFGHFKEVAMKISDLQKKLVECKEKLDSDIKELEAKIESGADIREKKLWQMELKNKNIYKEIVQKEQNNLNAEKFSLMENMQRLEVKTTKVGNQASSLQVQ